MADGYIERIHTIPVSKKCDVLVVGGGIAGIAAALAAARMGASTMLLEKQCVLGGLATSGLVTIYLPLCDGRGHQVSYGIAEELLRLSIKHGYQDKYPYAWLENGSDVEREAQRFEVQFNPVYFALEAEKLLLEAGVSVLYDARLTGVMEEDGRPRYALIEGEGGCQAIDFRAAVDASGSCALMQFAGEKTRRHGLGNTVAGWYYGSEPEGLKLHMLGYADAPAGSRAVNEKPLHNARFYGDEMDEVSRYLHLSHTATLNDLEKRIESGEKLEPAIMTAMPQCRMIRCLHGMEAMTSASEGLFCETSIGVVGDWRKRGPRYEVPYASLFGENENLFVSGRCVSVADDDMWDIMRVIPCCAVTGEAAGIAAALSGNGKRAEAREVQKHLTMAGQRLH